MSITTLILGRKSPGKIDQIQLDCVLRENHSFQNEVTNFPIEDGSQISDHIVRQPTRLTLDGFVTNSPVNLLGIASNLIKGLGRERVETALTELLVIQEGALDNAGNITHKLITVATGLRTYNDMAMVSLNIPRDRTTGDTLRFTAEFVRVNIATSEIVPVEKLKASVSEQGPSTISRGKQTATDASDATKNKVSWAKQLVNTGRELVGN